MDEDKQPGIRFHDIILVKELFERATDFPDKTKINLEFEFSSNDEDEVKDYFAELVTKLTCYSEEEEKVLTIECTHVAFFSVLEGQENMKISAYIKNNAAALMFPFIREHIHSITKKAGINPIALPPINIKAMLKNQEKKGI